MRADRFLALAIVVALVAGCSAAPVRPAPAPDDPASPAAAELEVPELVGPRSAALPMPAKTAEAPVPHGGRR